MNFIEPRRNGRKVMRWNGFEYNLDEDDILYEKESTEDQIVEEQLRQLISNNHCPHDLPIRLCMICNG